MQNPTNEYMQGLTIGSEYQDYIILYFYKILNRSIIPFSSRKFQHRFGETLTGEEIKLDQEMKRTGNIYIEIAEKSNANNLNYVSSGIYAKSRIHTYIIGDYSECFVFDITKLIALNESGKFRNVKTPTSKGFLIPKVEASQYAEQHIFFKQVSKHQSQLQQDSN